MMMMIILIIIICMSCSWFYDYHLQNRHAILIRKFKIKWWDFFATESKKFQISCYKMVTKHHRHLLLFFLETIMKMTALAFCHLSKGTKKNAGRKCQNYFWHESLPLTKGVSYLQKASPIYKRCSPLLQQPSFPSL